MVPTRAEDFARSQDTDTGQLGEGGAGCGDDGLDVGGGFSDAPVQVAYLGDEVHREAAQGLAGRVAGTGSAQKLGGLGSGELTLRAGRDEAGEHDMEAVDGLGAGLDQVVAMFDDRAERGDGALDGDRRSDCVRFGRRSPRSGRRRRRFCGPCPLESIRTRAASFAGTSRTSTPSVRSLAVSGAPNPDAPSIAHVGSGQRLAKRRNAR